MRKNGTFLNNCYSVGFNIASIEHDIGYNIIVTETVSWITGSSTTVG